MGMVLRVDGRCGGVTVVVVVAIVVVVDIVVVVVSRDRILCREQERLPTPSIACARMVACVFRFKLAAEQYTPR